jgi:hypothetical protein
MNKTSKWLLMTLAAGVAVALPICIVALQGSGQAKPAPRFTPVQLANGLAFNQGAVAAYLAVFDRPAVAVTGKLLAVERSVDSALLADPSLANRFASDAQSGSAAKVAVALHLLGRLTRVAFAAEFGQGSGRQLTDWARQAPNHVSITAPAYDSLCPDCVENSPPVITISPTPTYPWISPPLTCLTCSMPPIPPITPTPTPTPSPTVTIPPSTCPDCVENTPPVITITPGPSGNATVKEDMSSVPSGVALSLPYLMAGPQPATRAGRKDMAETIAVVAFSLDAD